MPLRFDLAQKSMKQKKVLFIYTHFSSFVKNDFEILSKEFDVTPFCFKAKKGLWPTLKELARQTAYCLGHIRKFDVVFIWFADQHSLIPVMTAKLTAKRSYLVVGGYDVCRIPSLNYGVFCSRSRGLAARLSMKYSSFNLAVSDHVERKIRFIVRKNSNIRIYNCIKPEIPASTTHFKRNMVLTVANIENERTFLLKGIDLFVDTARLIPEISFCIAGFNKENLEYLIRNFPENVTVLGKQDPAGLADLYEKSLVYCQLSQSESFGIALAEGIYYGCIPLITNQGGMPEVVGDKNQIVSRNAVEIASKIRGIFSGTDMIKENYPFRLNEQFSFNVRAKKIISLISSQ